MSSFTSSSERPAPPEKKTAHPRAPAGTLPGNPDGFGKPGDSGIDGGPGRGAPETRKKRRGPGRIGWGLIFAVLVIALADAYVFRSPYTYDIGDKQGARGGFIGQFAHIDRSFNAADPEQIEYAIFGDSQSIDGLRPDIMAGELGIGPERIFNFSVSAGKPTDAAYLYRRYIGRMPNLKRVIVVVNEHQFNNADAATDSKFRFHAGLIDRLRAMDTENYGELLAGWALRAFGLRTEWQSLVPRYRSGELPANPAPYPGGIEPLTWSPPEHRTAEYAEETADRWFKDWEPEGVYTRAFRRLIADMHLRGLEIAVVQLPRAASFDEAIERKYGSERDALYREIAAVAAAGGAEFAVLTAEGLGLAVESHFRDTNHLNPEGASIVSRYAARRWLAP